MDKQREKSMKNEEKAIEFIEKSRCQRKITQQEVAESSSSITNYKRYMRGESLVPLEKAIGFAEHLGLNPNHLLEQLGYIDRNEDILITRLVNAAATKDYREYCTMLEKIVPDNILKKCNRILYQYSLVLQDYNNGRILDEAALNKLKLLINYPEILRVKNISLSEFIDIGEIVVLSKSNQQEDGLSRLKELLKFPKDVIFDDNQKIILSLLTRIIGVLGENKQYEDAIYLCKKGINICCALDYTYCLEHFYYYLSSCYHKLNNYNLRDKYIPYVVIAATIQNDRSNLAKFCNLIKKNFNINALEIFNRFIDDFKQK